MTFKGDQKRKPILICEVGFDNLMEELSSHSSVVVLASSRAKYLSSMLEKSLQKPGNRKLVAALYKQVAILKMQGDRVAGIQSQLKRCSACDLCRKVEQDSIGWWQRLYRTISGRPGSVVDVRVGEDTDPT